MTIEIQELIIQARVVDEHDFARTRRPSSMPQGLLAQEQFIEKITRRVLEKLRDEQEQK